MERKVTVNNEVIEYYTTKPQIATDISFKLPIKDIYAIGVVSKFLDIDTFYIVFITEERSLKHIVIDYGLCGFNEFHEYLKSKFNIDILNELSGFYDNNKILYPQNLKGKRIYCDDLLTRIKRILLIINPAHGKLCEELFI